VANNWLSGRQSAVARAARTPQAVERWAATDASQQAVLDDLNAARDGASRAGTAQERQAAYARLQSATAAASGLAEGFRSAGDPGGASTIGRVLLGATTDMQRLAGELGITVTLSDAQRQGLAQTYSEMGMTLAAAEGSVASNSLGNRIVNALGRNPAEAAPTTSTASEAAFNETPSTRLLTNEERTNFNARRDDYQQYDQYRREGSSRIGGEWDWERLAPNNGAVPGTTTAYAVQPGQILDRYGARTGSYLAPESTPFDQRALAPGARGNGYEQYEVARQFTVERAEIAPAFGQPGGGYQIQYRVPEVIGRPATVNELIRFGYIIPRN
jgi:hypothetical protein